MRINKMSLLPLIRRMFFSFILMRITYVLGHDKIPEVHITDGELTMSNFNICIINNNGNEYTINNTKNELIVTLKFPVFGLVSWTCDQMFKGEAISFFTCGSCGIYCVYNQYIIKCKNEILPIIIALTISLSIFLIIIVCCLTFLKKPLTKLYAKIIVYFLMRSDRRRITRIIRYNKATGQTMEVKFKKVSYNNNTIDSMIIQGRLDLMKKLTLNKGDAIYSEIVYNRSADYHAINDMLKRSEGRIMMMSEIKDNKTYKKQRSANVTKAIVTGLALTTTMPADTYGCDQMLYIKSNGRICYQNKCYDLSTYSLSLADGETACFNDLNNDRLSIKLDTIHNIARFSSLYDTSSYNITNSMHWNCYGSGKCWKGEDCGNGYKLNILERNSKEPHGYGCHMTPITCSGFWCTGGVSCVWYRWQINSIGLRIPVYSLISEIWEVRLTIKYKGIAKTILLNTNNPKYDMNDILSEIMNHMPICITGVSYEKLHLRNSILSIDGIYFNVDASPHNMPQRGLIGDIQIDKHDTKIIYYDNHMDCSTDTCTVKCMTNEPAINRLISTSPYRVDTENIEHLKMYNEEWINYKYRSSGHGTITFGNVDLKELIVEKPHCNIKIGISYACYACNEHPRATLVSHNIKTEGMMDYESNCTWDRSTVSCNNEMYDIVQISKNKYCNMFIPMLNQSLDIIFDYEYRGVLSEMKTIKAETSVDIINDIVNNNNFITTLLTSLSSFLLFTGIATMGIKVIRLGVLAFGRREAQEA